MIEGDHDAEPERALRTRLWVPGTVHVTDAGDVHLGQSAGYSSHGRAFLGLSCGHRGRLSSWTHVAWLVPRSALHAGIVAAHGVILPELLIDRDAQPHAYRWLREQPLVCVSGLTWPRLAAAGVSVYRVAFDATGARVLDIEATHGSTGLRSLQVPLDALEDAMTAAWDGLALVVVQGNPSPIDRALRLVSSGALDEASVLNAFDARSLIEDGYGYRGALEGHFIDMDGLARELRPLDAIFAQIFERAEGMRPVAERLLATLTHATPLASEVSVPLYETARRIIVPPLRVLQVARLLVHGEMRCDLELPLEHRWSVDRIDAWYPEPLTTGNAARGNDASTDGLAIAPTPS